MNLTNKSNSGASCKGLDTNKIYLFWLFHQECFALEVFGPIYTSFRYQGWGIKLAMSSRTFSYYLAIFLLTLFYLVCKQFTPIHLFLLSLRLQQISFKYQVTMHYMIKTNKVSLNYKNDLPDKEFTKWKHKTKLNLFEVCRKIVK